MNFGIFRLSRQREKRLEDEKLRKVKTLGAAADDVDDLGAWVSKSRALEEKAKAEARAKALKQARALEEQVRCLLPHSCRDGYMSIDRGCCLMGSVNLHVTGCLSSFRKSMGG